MCLSLRRTLSGRRLRDGGDKGGRGGALLWKRNDDNWFTGSLKCSEIIPLAAQFP